MSTAKGLRAGRAALVLIGTMLAAAGTVGAQERFTTEQPASVLIFPKVINSGCNGGGGVDSIIQITNTTNLLTQAHCFYVNGAFRNGRPLWQVTDFEIVLTRQQPTHWSACQGRQVNPLDFNTPQAGIDPGLVPPVPTGFTGYLTCVEVDASGSPVSANSLKGEATVGDINGLGAVNLASKYNAIGIQACNIGGCGGGGVANDGDNVLELDNLEYAACPGGLLVNFEGEGGPDPAIEGTGNSPSSVSTNLTLVPCGADFENLIIPAANQVFNFRDEFETFGSVSSAIPVDCWADYTLDDPIFGGQLLIGSFMGSLYASGVLRPPTPTQLPVLGVANVLRTAGDGTSDTAATNLHFCTEPAVPSSCVTVNSEIRLPTFP